MAHGDDQSDADFSPNSPSSRSTPSNGRSASNSTAEQDSNSDSDSDGSPDVDSNGDLTSSNSNSDLDSSDSNSNCNSSDSSSDVDSSDSSGSLGSSDSSGNPDSDSSGDSDSGISASPSSEHTEAVVGPEAEHTGSWQAIARVIAASQKCNIRHDAAGVAESSMPFEDEDEVHAYTLALGTALASSEYPAGFGLNEEYESVESYKTGRSLKPLVIPLPYEVWFPRIIVWCKALDLLKRLPVCKAAVVP